MQSNEELNWNSEFEGCYIYSFTFVSICNIMCLLTFSVLEIACGSNFLAHELALPRLPLQKKSNVSVPMSNSSYHCEIHTVNSELFSGKHEGFIASYKQAHLNLVESCTSVFKQTSIHPTSCLIELVEWADLPNSAMK